MGILVILVLSGLAWYVNETLNKVALLNTVIKVVIVVVATLCLLDSLGLYHTNMHIQ